MIPFTVETDQTRRKLLEDKIEELLDLLDLIDADPDLEPNGDREPSLGWPGHGPQALECCGVIHDDREVEDENDEDGGDTEWNGDEADYDGGEADAPGVIHGGIGR